MIHSLQVKIPLRDVLEAAAAQEFREGIVSEEEFLFVLRRTAAKFQVTETAVQNFTVFRRSIDARRKEEIVLIYQVAFNCPQEKRVLKKYGKKDAKYLPGIPAKREQPPGWLAVPCGLGADSRKQNQVVITGMGPAGLFAALRLAHAGLSPVVVERGSAVEERQKKVAFFWAGGELDTECNVQFGEGGAGTFSDGKLNTMTKDKEGFGLAVLSLLVHFGAPPAILYQQKPHIGTDLLRGIVCAMREEIISCGGSVLFDTKLIQIHHREESLNAVTVLHRDGKRDEIPCGSLILAVGHSARDTVEYLYSEGVAMQAKPFAVGVRVEHPQEMIGKNQYGDWYPKLPAADYKLTYTAQNGRGVYSFCMCPGGYVVNASSEQGRLAVNGMSNHLRDGCNANSAIVVTVTPQDFGGEGALAGISFQRKWEEAAYRKGQGKIPVQLLRDFERGIPSHVFGEILPEMKGQYVLGNVREILPAFVGDAICEGMPVFGRRIRGYDRGDVLLSGIESRTSSPVRILRDETLQSNIAGIYPCGEGAGYAGGIMSAAMDGLRVAEAVIRQSC